MKHIAPLPPPPPRPRPPSPPHPSPSQDPLLRHRSSMATTLLQFRLKYAYSTFTTTTTTGSSASSSSSFFRTAPDDFRLLSTKQISLGCVSLQDLLPPASAPVDSPKSNVAHLPKQTAVRNGFLNRLWPPRVPTLFRHIFQALTRLPNWLLEAIRIRSYR